MRARSGITLLEVLVSIFVLAVGLLGLASLLPVARYYSVEASKYDRASALGQAVYHDLQLRGYLLPKTWLDTSTFASPAGPYGGYAVSTLNYPSTNLYSSAINPLTSLPYGFFAPPVVIDPLAVGYAIVNGQTPPPIFPAFLTPATKQMTGFMPNIFRLTLDSRRSWPNEDPSQPGAQLTMNYALAERLFRSNDDLIFQLPPNGDYRPQLVTNNALPPPAGVPPSTPDYQGDFSWFLTVSPDVDNLFSADAANMQRYSVSVVIIYKRDLNLDQSGATLDAKKAPPERVVYADLLDASTQVNSGFAFGINFSGGAVRLRTPATLPAPATPFVPPVTAAWLDVKPNEWLMLSAMKNANPAVPVTPQYITWNGVNYPVQVCQWYRIAGVGDTVQNPNDGSWYRDVQLAGPDWNNGLYVLNAYALYPTAPNPVQYQYATLVSGAIAVYDSQITLDESLLKD